MDYKVITAVATEPVTRAEAKLHLRIDDISGSHPDDALVDALITAAREYAEHHTGLALAAQTLEAALDEFPDCDYIDLPMPPVASITSLKYTDQDGVEQTLSTTKYALSTYGESRRIQLTYDNDWPDTRDINDAVRIRFVTGYAATGAGAGFVTLPKAARQGMLLLIGHWYEHRESVGNITAEIPMAADAVLNTIKIWGRT